MKTEISKLPLKEWKHSLGVFLQMGRVQLDSDWNEQSELSLRLLQRQTEDAIGTGSSNNGFHVDAYILLDAMDAAENWTAEKSVPADPDPLLYVDYTDFLTGVGSLSAEDAAVVTHKLETPRDFSQWKEIVFAAKGSFTSTQIAFFLGQGGTRGMLATTEDADQVNGWRIFRAKPATAAPAVDFTKIDELGFAALNTAAKYQFDYIKIDRPIRQVLVNTSSAAPFTTTTATPADLPNIGVNDTDRFQHSLVLEATNVTSVSYELPSVTDLSHARNLIVAARTSTAAPPANSFSVTDVANANLVLAGTSVAVGDWQVTTFALKPPPAGVDWTQVKSITWGGLVPATTYRFAPVMVESDLQGNLVIMGGDGTAKGAGRFYGDGLAAIKESHETYFSQQDLPEANPLPLAAVSAGSQRIDLVYLDMWERPITYIEDPDVREIALEGPDTCTRTKLIAQVRILKGQEVPMAGTPARPQTDFDNLAVFGKGVLTTKDKADAVVNACADPCEPSIAGTFLGQENQLFRIEIHACGQIGAAGDPATAIFKWSHENGAVATALIANAAVGDFAVKVEKPELFAIGDLIEISNDLIDLVTGPYEDRTNHRCHKRGELRKISSISLVDRLISWQDAGSPEPQFHTALPLPERLVYHPSVRRWDDVLPVTSGDIVLDDGVVVEFGGKDLIPGDYWVFATRVVDNSVERLVEQPPHGILHRYFPLAYVERSNPAGTEIVSVQDVRPHFDALTKLKATDIRFDPSDCAIGDPDWDSVKNVQQAIEALCRMEGGLSIEDHNKYLHGSGIVCGFQVHCNQDRKFVTIENGYALDCEGHVIRNRTEIFYDVVTNAQNVGVLDTSGDGVVWLSMTRGIGEDATLHVEAASAQTFWNSVLEGTLLKDFYESCIQNLIDFFKTDFLPISNSVPVSEKQKRLVSLINLLWQLLQPGTGRYIFLSQQEADDPHPVPDAHKFLRKFYDDLKQLISSATYCAEFDSATPFPDYPYLDPTPGIDTVFGVFNFHTRLRLHPNGKLAYTCGTGSKIGVFDMSTGSMIFSLDFPGGSNAQVQDVAISPDGNTLYAVALLNNQDSVFARASINQATNVHTWGPTNVVCDILFVTLGTTSAHAANLYAVGRSQGLFIFDPLNIPLTPTANVAFNATGMMEISVSSDVAIVGEAAGTPVGTFNVNFSRCSVVNLAAPAAPTVFFNCTGTDAENDIAFIDGTVYITGTLGTGKGLFQFTLATGALVASVDIGSGSIVRISPTVDKQWMLVTVPEQHKVERVDVTQSPLLLDTRFRIPVQIIPIDIGTNSTANAVYVLNLISCTLSTVDLPTVFATAPPLYTAEPPVTLSAYRTQIIKAFGDILKLFGQYLKDCFCERFLVNCPVCDKDDKVYLGSVEIKGNKIFKICNFTKRKYVKSEQTIEYWLSVVPIIPIFKKAFADFCCKII